MCACRAKTCLRSELRPEELAHLSRVTLEGEREVHDIEDDRFDAVTPSLHLPDNARHLVPASVWLFIATKAQKHKKQTNVRRRLQTKNTLL